MYIILIRPCRPRTARQIEIYNYDRRSGGSRGRRGGGLLLGYGVPACTAAPPRSGVGKETAIHTDLRAVV